MRYLYTGTARDGHGHVISGATVSVYLAGTTTAATIYTTDVIVTSVNSVTSDTDGTFTFYVDAADYSPGQGFDITISKSGYTSNTYEDIRLQPQTYSFYITWAGSVTLGANAATTAVIQSRVALNSKIFLMPVTASAAADVGSATGVYVTIAAAGSFTIHHPNTADVDKTFNYLVIS